MANITVTTAAVHIGEVWIPDVIRSQEFGLEIAPRVNRAWKFAGSGDVYHIPRVGNLAAASKAASTAWTPAALTDTEQTITINVHEVAGFQLEDIAELLSNTDLKAEYQRKLGYALGRSVDVNLATLPQNFSQIVGTLGSEVTYDSLLRAWQYLADGGTSLTDMCTWFFSPAAIAGLLKQDLILNHMYRTDANANAVETAKVGDILGAPVQQSNLTRAPSAGQSESFLLHQKGVALMMAQEPKIVTEYIAKELSWVVGSHQIYGYTEVDRYAETPNNVTAGDDWVVLIRTIG